MNVKPKIYLFEDLYNQHNDSSKCVCVDCEDYRREHEDNGHLNSKNERKTMVRSWHIRRG